jgi:SAM-dependent methyltransferase
MTISLDLGCGAAIRNPFGAFEVIGLDLNSGIDLAIDKLPYDDKSIDFVTCYDILEHIPRIIYLTNDSGRAKPRFAFTELMNEIYRVLKPGGKMLSHTPAFPYGPAFRDPTHVNIITEETFPMYFAGDKLASMYGFTGEFVVEIQQWSPPHLITILVSV